MSAPTSKNRRVLVIDDNPSIHEDFRKILCPDTADEEALKITGAALFGDPGEIDRIPPFEVDSASQGQEGMELVRKAIKDGRPYAMAFVDIRMPPGWDGVETTQKIWDLDADLQVVLCTAYSDYSWDEMVKRLGHSDGLLILKKPFDTVEVLQFAHALTEKWSLHQQSRRRLEDLEALVSARTQALEESNEALQRQQSELRVLFDLIPAMIWFKDTDNRILRVNKRAAERAGRRVEEMEGRPSAEIDPHEAAGNEEDDQAIIRSGIPKLGLVERMQGAQGEESWLQTDKMPYCGEDGRVLGIVVVSQDITERRRAELEVRLNEQRYRSLVEATAAVVWNTPPSGEFEEEQPRWTAFTGQSFESLRGWGWLKTIHPDDQAETSRAWMAALESSSMYVMEHRLLARDQTYRHMMARAVPILAEDGTVTGWIGVHTDITERKQTEAERDRLAAILESTTDMVSIADPSGQLIYLNRAGRRQLDVSLNEDITTSTIASFLPSPADHPIFTDGIPTAVRDGAWSGESLLRSRRGREFSVSQVILAHKTPGGKLEFLSTIVRDITERKRLEAQLFKSQKMETVGKLAGGIAHEFNSILTAILGQSDLLLHELSAGSPLIKNVAEISHAAGRAATLTRQLLAFGRKQLLQPEILDLNRMLASMGGMLQPLMGDAVETRIIQAPGLCAVKADGGQIEQVIISMAINARDAMPAGGTLTLAPANFILHKQSAAAYPELAPGDYVRLAISDTGTGMNLEVKNRLFEPFFSTKGIGQGTGLGLATCYGIVKQSGGHITVSTAPDRGTTFNIYLPQAESKVEAPVPPLIAPGLPTGTESILLVEQDPALREMAASLLARLGYTVVVAENGIDAMRQLRQHGNFAVDLLYTNAVMPGLTGEELAEQVHNVTPRARILFATAYPGPRRAGHAPLPEGFAMLQKPFTPSLLARTLREVLDQPPPAALRS